MPYGNIHLGQHWLRQWFVAWRHETITRTNVDLSSQVFCGIYLRAISQVVLINLNMCSDITFLKLLPHLPGANDISIEFKIHSNLWYMSECPFSSMGKVCQWQGADSVKRCHLTSKGDPSVKIRWSYDCLISIMVFPILVRWHLYT